MYSGGVVVGKASTIGIEISPTPPQFSVGEKVQIWRRFQHHSTLSRPRLKMQQDIRILKQTSSVVMMALCPLCAKIPKIINTSVGDCWNSLKFPTDFDHVTLDVPQTFTVNGSTSRSQRDET